MCGIQQENVYRTCITDLDELMNCNRYVITVAAIQQPINIMSMLVVDISEHSLLTFIIVLLVIFYYR